jgi:hypothetical protein
MREGQGIHRDLLCLDISSTSKEGFMVWDYKSYQCKTAADVKLTMEQSRKEGWGFHSVIKEADHYVLTMKKCKTERKQEYAGK